MLIEELIGAISGRNRRDRRRNAIVGVLTGLVGGGITALLLAPQSGAETRQDLAHATEQGIKVAKESAERVAEQASHHAHNFYDAASEKVSEVRDSLIETGREAERDARRAARKARVAARRTKEEAADIAEDFGDAAEHVKDSIKESAKDVKEDVEKA